MYEFNFHNRLHVLPANVIRFRKKSMPTVWLYTFPKVSWEKRDTIEVCKT